MAASELPSLRWGIIGCGLISSWFVSDLLLPRKDSQTKHIVEAVGSSSLEKGNAFLTKHAPSVAKSAKVYASYAEVYNDPAVDVVYIGTPHAFHLNNALDAINAGKHVLCEKPMTINAREADILISAAKKKGVFLMEAVWTRFFPVAAALQDLIHTQKILGRVSRVFVDFGLDMPLASLPPDSRVADPALGAGALLDIGIYTLTWADIVLSPLVDAPPQVISSLNLVNGVDEMASVILNYADAHLQAICTSSMRAKSDDKFCRVEGENGVITVGGASASKPGFLEVQLKGEEAKRTDFEVEGWGFHYEADAVAGYLREGKLESKVVPLEKTRGVIALMDKIRAQNGLKYKQDLE